MKTKIAKKIISNPFAYSVFQVREALRQYDQANLDPVLFRLPTCCVKIHGSIELHPSGGSNFRSIAELSCRLAKWAKSPVNFEFNGVVCKAKPTDGLWDVVKKWEDQMEENARNYRETDEYKQNQIRRVNRTNACQSKVNELMENIESVVHDERKALEWFRDFTESMDQIDVTCPGGLERVYQVFESAGWKENDELAPEGVDSAAYAKELEADFTRMTRYIIGQCLNFVNQGMSPHPVAITFADAALQAA